MTVVYIVPNIPDEPDKIYSEFILAEQETLKKIRSVTGGGFLFTITPVQMDTNFKYGTIKYSGNVKDAGNLRFIHVIKKRYVGDEVVQDEVIKKYLVDDDLHLIESQMSFIDASNPGFIYFNDQVNLSSFQITLRSKGLDYSPVQEVPDTLIKMYFKYRSYISARKGK